MSNAVAFAHECAVEARKLQVTAEKDRENFLASIGQDWDVSGPDLLIDPAYRAEQYAYAAQTTESPEFAVQWALRAEETLANALKIAEMNPKPTLRRIRKQTGFK